MRMLSSTTIGLILLLNTQPTLSNEITAYQWDFGDGSTSSEAKPNHEYKQPGFYQVTLKAFVNDKLSYSKQHLVDAVTPVIESFAISGEKTAKIGEKLSFKPALETSKPVQLNYVWTTHDGSEHQGSHYEFEATKAGTFNLSLSGFFEGRKVTAEKISYTISAEDTTTTPTTPTDKTQQSDGGGGSLFWLIPALFFAAVRKRK